MYTVNLKYPKECVGDYMNISFEGVELMINTEYDRILRMMYGDYMQFPPKEEQVCRHNPIDIMFDEDCDGLFVKEPIYGNKLISIIIPVYNKENIISKTLESVINQTYSQLEIIVINDGSTDQSLKVINKYKKEDNRIIIIDKKNAGVELARFDGIAKATGEYIMFVDGDDTIPKDSIELLMNAIVNGNADIAIGNQLRVIGKHQLIKRENKNDFYNNRCIDYKTFLKEHLQSFCGWGIFPISVWGKLYKRSLFDQTNLIKTGLTYGEDICMNLQIVPVAKKIVTIPDIVYYYQWGGVTAHLKDCLFDDAVYQYLFKTKCFKDLGCSQLIDYANVELANFMCIYVDACIDNYKNKEECLSKINVALSNETLNYALENINYDWYVNTDHYRMMINHDAKGLYELRNSNKKRKIKKKIGVLISKFI